MGLASEQVKQVLENLADHRQDLMQKIEKDEMLITLIRSEIGELEDAQEECEARLKKGTRLKKRYDQNIQQTQEAMDNLESTARRFTSTFAGLGKLKKESR
jgi:chromosome segregation ATPase